LEGASALTIFRCFILSREHERERINAEREKQNRIARDMALLQNSEYVKSKREFILQNYWADHEQKRIVRETRDKETRDRVTLAREHADKQKQLKKEENDSKRNKALEDKLKHDQQKTEELLRLAAEADEKRERIRLEQKAKNEANMGSSEEADKEKLAHVRANAEERLNDKVQCIFAAAGTVEDVTLFILCRR
jgi:pyruvoyl-dependent arginine decarboxylase (PvlArgDC)